MSIALQLLGSIAIPTIGLAAAVFTAFEIAAKSDRMLAALFFEPLP